MTFIACHRALLTYSTMLAYRHLGPFSLRQLNVNVLYIDSVLIYTESVYVTHTCSVDSVDSLLLCCLGGSLVSNAYSPASQWSRQFVAPSDLTCQLGSSSILKLVVFLSSAVSADSRSLPCRPTSAVYCALSNADMWLAAIQCKRQVCP